ncbi:MAG: ATP synthase F0 subunit B [Oscillospiraceae bacterium]|nr:ATP synthase F0 subunit B [Oscillospiraceae bacterium]MDD7470941.1 ATP synthase F0 subunit B [Oscillospiraceae bacterium]MDY2677499.1 ATP synthase F0 subunit B [Oscillospiraceae bacterium]
MSIDTLLRDMDTVLDEGKSVPFSNKLMVDVEELKRIIEDIRLNMPTEITQAKKIATERRDILNAADAEAEDILAKARQKADLMVEEHQITKEAREAARGIMQQAKNESELLIENSKERARDIMDKAEKWSGDMRRNASNYVESIIRDTDETLTKSVNDIRQLRQSVRDALGHTSESRPNIDL